MSGRTKGPEGDGPHLLLILCNRLPSLHLGLDGFLRIRCRLGPARCHRDSRRSCSRCRWSGCLRRGCRGPLLLLLLLQQGLGAHRGSCGRILHHGRWDPTGARGGDGPVHPRHPLLQEPLVLLEELRMLELLLLRGRLGGHAYASCLVAPTLHALDGGPLLLLLLLQRANIAKRSAAAFERSQSSSSLLPWKHKHPLGAGETGRRLATWSMRSWFCFLAWSMI